MKFAFSMRLFVTVLRYCGFIFINPDPSTKKKTLDKNVTVVKSIHEQKKNQKIKSPNSDTKKTPEQYVRQSPKSDPPPQTKTVQQSAKLRKSLSGENRYPKRQSLNPDPSTKKKTLDKNIRVPKSKTPEEKKNRKTQLTSFLFFLHFTWELGYFASSCNSLYPFGYSFSLCL
jgi:hypothetical protein